MLLRIRYTWKSDPAQGVVSSLEGGRESREDGVDRMNPDLDLWRYNRQLETQALGLSRIGAEGQLHF